MSFLALKPHTRNPRIPSYHPFTQSGWRNQILEDKTTTFSLFHCHASAARICLVRNKPWSESSISSPTHSLQVLHERFHSLQVLHGRFRKMFSASKWPSYYQYSPRTTELCRNLEILSPRFTFALTGSVGCAPHLLLLPMFQCHATAVKEMSSDDQTIPSAATFSLLFTTKRNLMMAISSDTRNIPGFPMKCLGGQQSSICQLSDHRFPQWTHFLSFSKKQYHLLSVSESVIDSFIFGNSYCISELCELVLAASIFLGELVFS